LRAILIETLLALTQKALKNVHMLLMTVQEDGTIKKKICLLTSLQTEAFVKNFETYIEYAEELHRMQGSENAALSNLGRNKTYDSTNAVYFFRLKNANVDSLETSLIHEG
jgi:hypothetical protein